MLKCSQHKYIEDEKKKAEIEKANKENKEREEAARQKQREDRQARVEADKKIILQKNNDKKDLQEKRDEMANNYNKLSVRKKVALLNDGADMQLFIEEMIKDAFIDYTEGTLKKEIDELKPYNPKGNDDDSLEKGKVIFGLIFSQLSTIEKPYLLALNGEEEFSEKEVMDGILASNFVLDGQCSDEKIRGDLDKQVDDNGEEITYG
ncbi:MAG TPA: hypothetical protein DEO87_04735 [Lachnospiraceae bacterium]|nr:hypothetical protein [Lachnospiraceae bacterium]